MIRLLTDAYQAVNATIDHNLFERTIQGPDNHGELLSVKAEGVTIANNTVLDSPEARLTLREANRALVEGNYLDSAGGIRAHDDDHVFCCNRLGGGVLELRAGDCTMDTTQPEVTSPAWPRSCPTAAPCTLQSATRWSRTIPAASSSATLPARTRPRGRSCVATPG